MLLITHIAVKAITYLHIFVPNIAEGICSSSANTLCPSLLGNRYIYCRYQCMFHHLSRDLLHMDSELKKKEYVSFSGAHWLIFIINNSTNRQIFNCQTMFTAPYWVTRLRLVIFTGTSTMFWRNFSSIRGQKHKNWRRLVKRKVNAICSLESTNEELTNVDVLHGLVSMKLWRYFDSGPFCLYIFQFKTTWCCDMGIFLLFFS